MRCAIKLSVPAAARDLGSASRRVDVSSPLIRAARRTGESVLQHPRLVLAIPRRLTTIAHCARVPNSSPQNPALPSSLDFLSAHSSYSAFLSFRLHLQSQRTDPSVYIPFQSTTRTPSRHEPRSTMSTAEEMSFSPTHPVEHAEFDIEGVLFDMDGTLVDSIKVCTRSHYPLCTSRVAAYRSWHSPLPLLATSALPAMCIGR